MRPCTCPSHNRPCQEVSAHETTAGQPDFVRCRNTGRHQLRGRRGGFWLVSRRLGRGRQDELARTAARAGRPADVVPWRPSANWRAWLSGLRRPLRLAAASWPATASSASTPSLPRRRPLRSTLRQTPRRLDELLIEAELPLAEVEVLQAGFEASQADQEPVEIDMAALAGRSGAVESPPHDQAGPADDLILIDGIGPVYAARLREHGILTFARLAETGEAALAEIIQAPAWRRPNFAAWIDEAAQRAAAPVAGSSTPAP